MKKVLLVLLLFLFQFFLLKEAVFAQAPTLTPSITSTPTIVPTAVPSPPASSLSPIPGTWVKDAEVTFVGKVASRSGLLLDWTLKNYGWAFVEPGASNPLTQFWVTVRNLVYAFLALFILATAFIIIITRGRSMTALRFIPRFLLMVLLVTFSFSLIQFLYQMTDIVQGFFLKKPDGSFISASDLLTVFFDYKSFEGYRLSGLSFAESASVSLLLTKFTSVTYFVMTGILLFRKIILWSFIVVSPLFPLLLLYKPIRNTAKIWMGEFFRWLLYGPVFTLLLSSIVTLWNSKDGIPLKFDFLSAGDPNSIVYPTAVNILLGGPGQDVSLNNSINTPDTFVFYMVALLMMWIAILLPFILLQMFLGYINTLSFEDNSVLRQLLNKISLNKFGVTNWPSQAPHTGIPSNPIMGKEGQQI